MSVETERNADKSENVNNILVAEDSKTEQLHLRQLLEASGYNVAVVESGKAALESIDGLWWRWLSNLPQTQA